MKIGIDARLLYETGVGRYIRNLISHLAQLDNRNEYVIFLTRKGYGQFDIPNSRFKKVLADVHWHSIAEQIVMPFKYYTEKLDLVHVPYFNIPVLYTGKIVITIHDLTTLSFPTGRATKLPKIFYGLKLIGLKVLLYIGLKKASHIIAVSETTKKEILKQYAVNPDKIQVTYEGAGEIISGTGSKPKKTAALIGNAYFLYVGNAYPHKNIIRLLTAFKNLITTGKIGDDIRLVLVGPDDYFYREIRNIVSALHFGQRVIFYGFADDAALANLYSHAQALIFPSLSEGFGLPALEALFSGTSVACSDLPVFREILGPHALYFNPYNEDSISSVMIGILKHKKILTDGEKESFRQKFSWRNMAFDTLKVYESSVHPENI